MNELLAKVSIDNMYQIITDLEGPKYPLDNMDKLNEAADYIYAKLQSYGLNPEFQEFYIEGMTEPFKNVIARIGNPNEPATLIGSHYDTVRNAPGANDNLSAVAVSLEVARVLSEMANPPSVIIAAFTLEEGHPAVQKEIDERLLALGLIDDKYRYTSAKLLHFSKEITRKYIQMRKKGGRNRAEIYTELYDQLKNTLAKDELNYLQSIIEVHKKYVALSPVGKSVYSVGSYKYADSFSNIAEEIKDVIVYDCLGWVNENSKKASELPLDDQFKPLVQSHMIDINDLKRNFIAVFGDKGSAAIMGKFLTSCKNESINMPYLALGIPFDYETIRKNVPDVLRSDHGIFWQKGITGLFVSDMANFRSAYYHTPADISKFINYEALSKIAQATLSTLLV